MWKIERISTFDDEELANKINEIEQHGNTIKQIIYMGDNCAHIRIYQIIYKEKN